MSKERKAGTRAFSTWRLAAIEDWVRWEDLAWPEPGNKNQIWPDVFVGDMAEADNLAGQPGWAIICVCEHSKLDKDRVRPAPTVCLPTLDSKRGYKATVESLSAIAAEIDAQLAAGKRVLVHCWQGMERSPLAVVWWLRTRQDMTLDEAYAYIKVQRPVVIDRREWLVRKAAAA